MNENTSFEKRDRLIADRLWQMKKAATEIMNLVHLEIPNDSGLDCDGACTECVLGKLITPLHCADISEIADYPLEFALNDDRHFGGI